MKERQNNGIFPLRVLRGDMCANLAFSVKVLNLLNDNSFLSEYFSRSLANLSASIGKSPIWVQGFKK